MKQSERITYGTATAAYNPITGDWLIWGAKTSPPYLANSKQKACQLLLTIHHYEQTGEVKAFSAKQAKQMIDGVATGLKKMGGAECASSEPAPTGGNISPKN